MKKMIISLALCLILGGVVCAPAMGGETGRLNLSNKIWG